MTFLPIVQRELRTAAQRKSTFRLRLWTVLIAFWMGVFGLMVAVLSRGRIVGPTIFGWLTGYAFGLCLLAGPFLTSDCVSQEKREGTLGLLFLTDLKGYDVILGKFIGASLNAFYALLAVLPIVALPVLAGGVTGAEFWRSSLALLNALFFSLATGIFVSTLGRNSRAVLGLALALVLAMVALPLLSVALSQATGSVSAFAPLIQDLGWPSPFHAFSYARETLYASTPGKFWGSFATSHVLAWVLLALASVLLPRIWQQRTVIVRTVPLLSRLQRIGRGTAATRSKLLSINPVLWLMGSQPVFRAVVWSLALGYGLYVIGNSFTFPIAPYSLYTAKGCVFVLKMLVAIQACRFFAESRRDGTLELLLHTPLKNNEIVKGQWLALRRVFLWPLLALAFCYLVVLGLHFREGLVVGDFSQMTRSGAGVAGVFYFALGMAMDFFAIGWFGMWLALTTKRPNLAAPLTILFVLIIPSPALCGDLLIDVFFIVWGASKLQTDFRWITSEQYTRRIRQPMPTLPRASGAPPVIARPSP